jgi:hypothetical protein
VLLIDKRLVDACVLLLGSPPRRVSIAFVQGLDVGTVRRAWRVIAMASHPDAVRRNGIPMDGRRFVEASRAYEFLMSYLLSRPAHFHPARRGAAERHATSDRGAARPPAWDRRGPGDRRGPADRHWAGAEHRASAERQGQERRRGALFYRGPVPHRRLRLAEYLYYSGRVSWQSLVSALVWQRASQPRFGELARDLRSISSQDLVKILSSRLRHEHTGETALRLQLLSAAQVDRILRLQRARRRLIGRYFVEKESMSAASLYSLLYELHRHNAHWGRS